MDGEEVTRKPSGTTLVKRHTGEHPTPNKLHAESTLAEHMRKGRPEGLKPADPSRIWPDPTACAASHQAGGRPERARPSATAWIHRPRHAERPRRRPIPQPQDHRNSSLPSAARRQGRRASRRVVGARRLPEPATHAPPDLRSAGAAARRHQPPDRLFPVTFAGSGGRREEEGGDGGGG
jgi:hypothetical protein